MACTKEPDGFDGRLELLSMAQRAVFLLSRLDGLTYDEIGWRLRLDTERVRRHFARAIYTIAWGPPRRWWNPWRRDADGG